MLDPRFASLGDLFSVSVRFRIPIYQRRYVWTVDDWARLWSDVEDKTSRLYNARPSDHFTGTIVLQELASETSEPIQEIIDGQQRLTTFQIIFCALRNISDNIRPGEELSSLVKNLLENPSLYREQVDPTDSYKLLPLSDSTDRDAFIQLITQRPRQVTHRHSIIDAYDYFHNRLYVFAKQHGATEAQLKSLATVFQCLLQHFKVVRILLKSQPGDDNEAERIFESLNGRGRSLTAFDHLRNNLFLRAGLDKSEFYRLYWRDFDSDAFWAKNNNNNVFFKYFLTAQLLERNIEKKKLKLDAFELYQTEYRPTLAKTHDNVESEFIKLSDYSKAYREIASTDYQYADHHLTLLKEVVGEFNLQSWYPIVMFIRAEVEPEKATYLYHIMESYLVRLVTYRGVTYVSSLDSGAQNPAIELLAKSGAALEPVELLRAFRRMAVHGHRRDIFPEDNMMKAVFENRAHADRSIKRYLLHRIEREKRSNDVGVSKIRWENDDFDLEHVMPQRWESTWPLLLNEGRYFYRQVFREDGLMSPGQPSERDLRPGQTGEERADFHKAPELVKERYRCVENMGNLTVLTENENKRCANHRFEVKRRVLMNSPFLLNHEIAEKESWDVEDIRERERDLFVCFTKIWPSTEGFYKEITGYRDELAKEMDHKNCILATHSEIFSMSTIRCGQYTIRGTRDVNDFAISKRELVYMFVQPATMPSPQVRERPSQILGRKVGEVLPEVKALAEDATRKGAKPYSATARNKKRKERTVNGEIALITSVGDIVIGEIKDVTEYEIFLRIRGTDMVVFKHSLYAAVVPETCQKVAL